MAQPVHRARDGTRAEVIAKHRAWLCDQPDLMAALPDELRGRDLYCWVRRCLAMATFCWRSPTNDSDTLS